MTDGKHYSEKQSDEIEAYFADAKREEPYRDKLVPLAYIWLFFLGLIMAHRLYLGRWRSAVLILAIGHIPSVLALLTVAGILPSSVLSSSIYPYFVNAGAGLIIAILVIDIFRIPSMVKAYNVEAKKRRVALGLEQ